MRPIAHFVTFSIVGVIVLMTLLENQVGAEAKSIPFVHDDVEAYIKRGLLEKSNDIPVPGKPVPSTSSHTNNNKSERKFSASPEYKDSPSGSYQDFLTGLIKLEKSQKRNGLPIKSHSRVRREKIKILIKKIIFGIFIFIKILVKHFVIVAKKAAIVAG